MADKTVTVRPSGGDYTSLSAAFTGEVAANPNLVTMDGNLYITIEGDWSGSTDTARARDNGFTQDATHHIIIQTNSANRAGTSWDEDKYALDVGFTNSLIFESAYTQMIGVQIKNNYGSDAVKLSAACTLDSCFLKTTNNSGSGMLIEAPGGKIINCIILGGTSVANGIRVISNGATLYNNTVVGCSGDGIDTDSYNTVQKNNYAGGNGGADYVGTAGSLTTCYSEDGTRSTSTAAYSTSTFTNVTSGSEDFSLVSGSDLIGVGTDLSADATYPFNWDITGATRTTWDVGAAYYASAVAFFFKRLKSVLLRR